MKILLTGHKGFIGRHLHSRLAKKHTVYGLDSLEGNNLLDCDLNYDVDLVIHLAAKTGVRDSFKKAGAYWNTNVEASKRLFKAFPNTRILYASSSSIYAPELNPYAASKAMLERVAEKHLDSLGMRFHTVYSDKPRSGMFMDKLIHGTLEYVTKHMRDFIHVDDVCDAVELLISSDLTGVVDVGTGVAVPVQNFAPHLPFNLNTDNERQHTQANTEILQQLGFEPKYNVKKFLTNLGVEHII